jgi:GT2 family glycosyltransferase
MDTASSPATRRTVLADLELSESLALRPRAAGADLSRYDDAIAVARYHAAPLGTVNVPALIDAEHLAQIVWDRFSGQIIKHASEDGLAPPTTLGPLGIPTASIPPCLAHLSDVAENGSPITVVIPTRGRNRRLTACLRSLQAVKYRHFNVIVVDNERLPDNTTRRVVEGLSNDRIPVEYRHERTPGASAARNRGFVGAASDHVVFFDNDVIVDPWWLAAVADAFRSSPTVGCVTGPVVPLHITTKADEWMLQYADFRQGYAREVFSLTHNPSARPLYPYNPGIFGSGGGMAFSRPALSAIGGFDVALGPATPSRSGEELAAFLAVVLAGYQLVFEPRAIVSHDDSLDYNALRRRVFAYGIGSTAFLTKTAYDRPSILPDMARKAPRALHLLTAPSSPKHERHQADFPRRLNLIEAFGMLLGPAAFIAGKLAAIARTGLAPGRRS